MSKFCNNLKSSNKITRFILKIHLCTFSHNPSVYGRFQNNCQCTKQLYIWSIHIVFHALYVYVLLKIWYDRILSLHIRNTLPFLLFSDTGIFLRKCLLSANLSNFPKELLNESFSESLIVSKELFTNLSITETWKSVWVFLYTSPSFFKCPFQRMKAFTMQIFNILKKTFFHHLIDCSLRKMWIFRQLFVCVNTSHILIVFIITRGFWIVSLVWKCSFPVSVFFEF